MRKGKNGKSKREKRKWESSKRRKKEGKIKEMCEKG